MYAELSFLGPGGSILATWGTIVVTRASTGTSHGTPWGPDLHLLDLGRILGPTWKSLSKQFGCIVSILDAEMGVWIRNSVLIESVLKMNPGEVVCKNT